MKAYPATLLVIVSALLIGCAPAQIRSTSSETNSPRVLRPVVAPDNNAALENSTATDQATAADSPRSAASSTPRPSNPAAVALRDQAAEAQSNDDLPTANRLLERALRIDPRDAATYLALAQLRARQDQQAAAEQLIDKGLSLRPAAELEEQLKTLASEIKIR